MTPNEQGVLVDRRDGVATITLNHPERANALDPAEFHSLARTLADLGDERELVAVVLTGQGERAFCAGLNLRNGAAIAEDLRSEGLTGLGAALRAAARLKVPLIGRINGACVAGGMGLMGACDHVVAVESARFGLPEIKHGIFPHVALAGLEGRGSSQFLLQLAQSGEIIDAKVALENGLVDRLLAFEGLDACIVELVADVRLSRAGRRLHDPLFNERIDRAEAAVRDNTAQ